MRTLSLSLSQWPRQHCTLIAAGWRQSFNGPIAISNQAVRPTSLFLMKSFLFSPGRDQLSGQLIYLPRFMLRRHLRRMGADNSIKETHM